MGYESALTKTRMTHGRNDPDGRKIWNGTLKAGAQLGCSGVGREKCRPPSSRKHTPISNEQQEREGSAKLPANKYSSRRISVG